MWKHIWRMASFGGQYLPSGLIYLGMAFMVWGTVPDVNLRAQAGGSCDENACPAGYYCCVGVCIPESSICCGDGTNGDATNCSCCTGCSIARTIFDSPGNSIPTCIECTARIGACTSSLGSTSNNIADTLYAGLIGCADSRYCISIIAVIAQYLCRRANQCWWRCISYNTFHGQYLCRCAG